MAPQIAFIGMGLMGQAITANLVSKGNLSTPLILYNRTLQRAVEHGSRIQPSTVATSLEDVMSKADIIWSCVQDQIAVEQTFTQIFSTGRSLQGKLFIESSTILPEATTRIVNDIVGAGGEFVAMPVFGDPAVARVGKLICVPAGPAASVLRVLPFLENVIAQAVIDLSDEEPRQASLLKIIGSVMVMSTMEMVAEVNVFAEKTGLGRQNAQKLVDAFPKAASIAYSRRMNAGEYLGGTPMVEVSKAQALASEVLGLAKKSQVSLPSYEAAAKQLAIAEQHAGPKCDITSIYGAVRVQSGLKFLDPELMK